MTNNKPTAVMSVTNESELLPMDAAQAYFERGFVACHAWHLTRKPDSVLSDAVMDHAWDHREEGGELPSLPTPSVDAEASEVTQGEEGGWQPIESAPRDGSFVLLFGSLYEPPVSMGYWDDAFGITKNSGWMMVEADTALSAVNPTHWMPLPAAPESSATLSHVEEGGK